MKRILLPLAAALALGAAATADAATADWFRDRFRAGTP